MSLGTIPTRDALDDKANRLFAGKVVRKDLVRKVKVGANVPVFVSSSCSGSTARRPTSRDPDGAAGRQRHAGQQLHPPDESMKAQAKVKDRGRTPSSTR
jgi:ATP-dependent Lon protease